MDDKLQNKMQKKVEFCNWKNGQIRIPTIQEEFCCSIIDSWIAIVPNVYLLQEMFEQTTHSKG